MVKSNLFSITTIIDSNTNHVFFSISQLLFNKCRDDICYFIENYIIYYGSKIKFSLHEKQNYYNDTYDNLNVRLIYVRDFEKLDFLLFYVFGMQFFMKKNQYFFQ